MVEKSRQFDRRYFIIRTDKVNYFSISRRRECTFFYLMTDCSLSLRRVQSTFKRNTEERELGIFLVHLARDPVTKVNPSSKNFLFDENLALYTYCFIFRYFVIFSATGSFTITHE